MDKFKFSKRVIDRFEEMITKEIEHFLYDVGSICPTALCERLEECIEARRELNYAPIPQNVEELLFVYNYDEAFINSFIEKSKKHTVDECPEL